MTGRKKWILLTVLLFHLHGKAQSFAWKSVLDTVPRSGFYNIPLSLDWLVHLKSDLSDIRIKDEKNRAVTFVMKSYVSEKKSAFINYPILTNTTDSIGTTLELDASQQQGTDHICLLIGNHAVERFASLSGSNDKKHWFIIDEKLHLTNSTGFAEDRFIQQLSFPFVRYRYLKLLINNKGTDPLPLLKAGIYSDTTITKSPPLFLEPGTIFQQKDSSDGRTYITVRNSQAFPVDRISMKLSGPKFYKRLINIYAVEAGKAKELVATGEVRSGEDPAIWLTAGKAQNFLLVIENGDNPPLQVNAVTTQCKKQELVAYLEKGENYALVGGNDSVGSPNYDLNFFRDSIPSHLATLEYGEVVANNREVKSSATNKNWWIWPAVILMVIVLALLTYRLMSDIKKTKES
ncbi:MAG TPA: hypothetical protein VNT20_12335 [Flavisolibacter sp.]|nr:hypothetical protein [Flavisolibacter sp.]